MKERPILFSAPMVKALLDGRKTQTRRIVKTPPAPNHLGSWEPSVIGGSGVYLDKQMTKPAPEFACLSHTRTGVTLACPYGVPGDHLWVRETLNILDWAEHIGACVQYAASTEDEGHGVRGWTHDEEGVPLEWGKPLREQPDRDKPERVIPAIFMPRWASRITLEITGIRVERVQEISEDDAKAEGVEPWEWNPDQPLTSGERAGDSPYRSGYAYLWDCINDHRATWLSNPWVWVVEFRRAR